MPYRPLNIANTKIDAKLASILILAQKEYENIVEYSKKTHHKKKKNLSEKVFDFFLEPKFNNVFDVFPNKKKGN